MIGAGRREIDRLTVEIEKEIHEVYKQAIDELQEKIDGFNAQFDEKQKKWKKQLDEGKITRRQYQKLMKSEIMQSEHWKNLRDTLVADCNNANQIAASIINGHIPEAYSIGQIYESYSICRRTNMNVNFSICNRHAVERLIRERPDLLPFAEIDETKDIRWNRQKMTSALLQGILQGESMDGIAARLVKAVGMNETSAIRNARTMTTGAMCAGRNEAFEQAAERGIDMEEQWVSTLDSRTRHRHVLMDGEKKKVEDTFSNGMRYPGDPRGRPEDLYNCRCSIRGILVGITPEARNRFSRLGNVSYDEWKAKALEKQQKAEERQRRRQQNNSQ